MRHLVLLIGTNPLPNAVTAVLLAGETSKITLFHSTGSREIADRLHTWIAKRLGDAVPVVDCAALSEPGHEYRPDAIASKLVERLSADSQQERFTELHVHYTGGTKTMSVHARDAARRWCQEQSPNVPFRASYLDPDRLALIYDPDVVTRAPQSEHRISPDDMQFTMTDFLDLHGWDPNFVKHRHPILPELARELARAHSTQAGIDAWDHWKCWELWPKAKVWKYADLPGRVAANGAEQAIQQPSGDWLNDRGAAQREQWEQLQLSPPSDSNLPKLWNPEPGMTLKQVIEVLSVGELTPKNFCRWLDGNWLESAVLQTLLELRNAQKFHEVLMNVEPKRPADGKDLGFEFDVIAIRGYRLFAFSCTTGKQSKGQLKHKLFEASVRARQMGGDEARTALVCCATEHVAARLEQDLERELDLNGKIAVFGQTHLSDLATYIGAWLDEN